MFTKLQKFNAQLIMACIILSIVSKPNISFACATCIQAMRQSIQNEQWTGVANWQSHIGQPNPRLGFLKAYEHAPFMVILAINTGLTMAFWSWSTADSAANDDYDYWWIKLTHWTLALQTFYQGAVFYSVFISLKQVTTPLLITHQDQHQGHTPIYGCVAQVLQSIALPSSLLVSMLYWVLVYNPANGPAVALSYMTHGVGFVLNALTHAVSNHPYTMRQGVFFLSYGVGYLAWTGISYAAGLTDEDGNHYIYKAIDWSKPKSTGIMVAVLVGIAMPLTHTLLWLASNGLSWCYPVRSITG